MQHDPIRATYEVRVGLVVDRGEGPVEIADRPLPVFRRGAGLQRDSEEHRLLSRGVWCW